MLLPCERGLLLRVAAHGETLLQRLSMILELPATTALLESSVPGQRGIGVSRARRRQSCASSSCR